MSLICDFEAWAGFTFARSVHCGTSKKPILGFEEDFCSVLSINTPGLLLGIAWLAVLDSSGWERWIRGQAAYDNGHTGRAFIAVYTLSLIDELFYLLRWNTKSL